MEGAKVILEASVTKCEVDGISASLRGSKNLEEALQSGGEREREREKERIVHLKCICVCTLCLVSMHIMYNYIKCTP